MSAMLGPFEETRILALIEGELRADEAVALETELAAHPELAARIDGMRADRTRLRGLREPEVPAQLLAGLEPVLARPMLIEAQPGAYRRRYRRADRRRRLARLAVAAGLFLMIGAGGLLAVVAAVSGNGEADLGPMLADDGAGRTPGEALVNVPRADEDPDAAAAGRERAPRGGTVHHHPPVHVAARDDVAPPAGREPRRRAAGDGAPERIDLPFALVVRSAEPGAFQAALATLVGGGDEQALVENVTYAQLREMEARWLASQARSSNDRPMFTADLRTHLSATQRLEVDRRVRRIVGMPRPERDRAVERRRQLAGPESMAAPYSSQIEYSMRGATHTVTVPLSRLSDLLASIGAIDGTDARLRTLPETMRPLEDAAGGGDWIGELRAVRETLAQLEASSPGALVHLPLVVVAD